MSPEFTAIIAVGVSLAGFMFTLHMRLERRIDRMEQRVDWLEENTNRRFDRAADDVKHRFGEVGDRLRELDTRLRTVEQNQSHLTGELSSIRELLRLQPVGLD